LNRLSRILEKRHESSQLFMILGDFIFAFIYTVHCTDYSIPTVIPWEKDSCFLITALLFSYKVSEEGSIFKGIVSRDELALSWPDC